MVKPGMETYMIDMEKLKCKLKMELEKVKNIIIMIL